MKIYHPVFEETYQQLTHLLAKENDIARRQLILNILRSMELDKTGVSLDANLISSDIPVGNSVNFPLN